MNTSEISIGVDAGSVSTKLAAICGRQIFNKTYLRNKPGLEGKSGCNNISCNICNDSCSLGFILKIIDAFIDSIQANYSNIKINNCVVTGNQMRNARIIRELNERLPTVYITEIFAHASGVEFLFPGKDLNCAIIEIGGLDSKIIITDNVRKEINCTNDHSISVIDSAMNNICAAGTGAYFESLAEFLNISIEDFGRLACKGFNHVKKNLVSSHCATFARSMFARLQQVYTKDELAAAACKAQADTILSLASPMLTKYSRKKIIFQGGVASNEGMICALQDAFKRKITIPTHPEIEEVNKLMGALGAAYMAEKYRALINRNVKILTN